MKKINIGIVGFGTVGAGVAKVLTENSDVLTERVGAELVVRYVADLDIETDRGVTLGDGVLTTEVRKVITDPEVDIVIELIGGLTIAKEITLEALQNGKHVVTANKALIAGCGQEIIEAAIANDVDYGFEASVAGCIPVIKSLREALAGNHVTSVSGILNGTCNYILSKIANEGVSFEKALADAQAIGYAEADPTLDIEGIDASHKLAIIMAIAYGMEISLDDIYVEGITGVTLEDIEHAEQLGYKVKLLAISKKTVDEADGAKTIEARIHPTMIPADNLFAGVNDSLNAVDIHGDAVGKLFLVGAGAGMLPTASAVVSDIVDVARNIISCNSSQRIPVLSYQPANVKKINVMPIDDVWSRYYFRFSVLDRPGVLSKISGILGEHDISIKSVQQTEERQGEAVPIVMLTGLAREANVKAAIDEINRLDITTAETVLIRIEEDV